MSETLTLPVLPLDDEVVLPGMVVPIELSDAEVRGAVDAARNSAGLGRGPGIRSEEKSQVLLVPRIGDRGLAGTGTLAVIEQVGRMPGGEPGAVLRGVSRVKIGHGTTGPGAALWVEGTVIEETGQGARATELAKEYKSLVVAIAPAARRVAGRRHDPAARRPVDAGRPGRVQQLPDRRAEATLLETADIVERLETAIKWTREHLAELDVAETIRKDVTEGMEKQQKEFLLRQQLAAVRKELKELTGDGDGTEEDDYRARVEGADLPEKVREAALKEVDKLERTSEQSPEVGWIRTWLDTILDIPWNERTEDAYDIAGARAILDEDHTGLDDVKERIIEYLAVRKRRQRPRPRRHRRPPVRRGARARRPARRRQDLARRVGRAGDGPEVRPGRARRRQGRGGDPRSPAHLRRRAAGPDRPRHPRGRHDEPGRAARRGGQDRRDYRGDPASALLEVLDPAQNHTFRDHYLEVDLDLSDVVFLATANVLDSIPGPLLDRMELVTLDGYTEDEKVAIAPRPPAVAAARQGRPVGRGGDVDDDALRLIAAEYTREAGVRSLERAIARVLRKVAAKEALEPGAIPVTVGADEPQRLPGPAPVHPGDPADVERPPHGGARRRDRPGGHRRGR